MSCPNDNTLIASIFGGLKTVNNSEQSEQRKTHVIIRFCLVVVACFAGARVIRLSIKACLCMEISRTETTVLLVNSFQMRQLGSQGEAKTCP